MASGVLPQLVTIEKEVRDIFKILTPGFQRMNKIKNVGKQSKQLEDLIARMREAKRLIKQFEREVSFVEEESKPNSNLLKLLNEKMQSLMAELNSFVALKKASASAMANKKEVLSKGSHAGSARDRDVRLASSSRASIPSRAEALHFFLSWFSCDKNMKVRYDDAP